MSIRSPHRSTSFSATRRRPEELERALLRGCQSRSAERTSVGIAEAEDWTHTASWCVDWRNARARSIDELPDLLFRTSGHTGEPAAWIHSGAQLGREVELLARIAGIRESDAIVTFAPPRHLYGLLFAYCVPAAFGLPVWHVAASDWAAFDARALGVRRPLFVALPAVLPLFRSLARWDLAFATIVHSTSVLPDLAAGVAEVPQVDFVELFGATETGLVAHRHVDGAVDRPWLLADDVEAVVAVPGEVGVLTVSSPRIGRRPGELAPETLALSDYVEYVDERRFRFVGRAARLVKVNGKRLDLDAMENVLRRTLRCADLACLPRRDSVRGEAYDLLLVPDKSTLDPAVVRVEAAHVFAEFAAPRRVRLVKELPRSATGKLLVHEASDDA